MFILKIKSLSPKINYYFYFLGRGGPPRPNRGMPQMNAQQVN